jgi:hypothetical protein
MIAPPAQALSPWTQRLSQASPVTRALVAHERALAILCALGTAIIAFEPRIRGGGLIADDWTLYSDVKFPSANGYHTALAALANSAGSRIGASLYWLASISLFGGHTRLYLALAALLAVIMAFSVYMLLRELHFSILPSLAVAVLTIAAPSVETVRFWFTPSGSQISLALFFFGLTLALRAFSSTGARSRRLHAASWGLYVLSAAYAEVALPLMGVCVLVYLTRARVAASLRRWGCDLVIVVVGYLGASSFVTTTKGFVKLPHSMWAEHARLLGDQALTIFTRMLGPFSEGARNWELLALGLLAGVGLVVGCTRASEASRRELVRWAFAFLVSAVAILAAYTTYVPAMLYYEPLGPGLATHINIVIAAPLAVGVFSVLMFARVVVAELLAGLRPRTVPLATALVAVWFAVIFANGIGGVRNDGHIWAVSGSRGEALLRVLTSDLRDPVHGSTVYTFEEAGTVAPGLPVFFSNFELTNAAKVAYHRGDVSAYPVVVEDDVLHCGPRSITVDAGNVALNLPSPYGRSYFFDVSAGKYAQIDSLAACNTTLSDFHPGPYSSGTTLKWSL